MTTPAYREQRWTSADGLDLYCRVFDASREGALTVMCLPGLTRNSRDFEALAPHLAARYRVVCPDLRGRGHSARDPQWRNYHPGTYLADLQRLMEVLKLERVAVVGTSLGGLLGMMLGATAPERVAGLVLNDVGPEVDPRGIERIRSYTGLLPPVRTWDEAVKQYRAVNGNAWPDLPDERWSALVRRSYRADASGVPVLDCDPRVGDALRAAPPVPGDLWPLFARLHSIPMLVIHGALSDILSVSTLERMQREKPDLERVTVGNRGHVPLLDEPQVLPVIDRFLARLPP
ncbi:MAG TPA: alpha/beta hydrolase [Steroidobacteraceae bacterium]|nr:alpha/beta hydrolase [Steroidobacteraceae bacterium]